MRILLYVATLLFLFACEKKPIDVRYSEPASQTTLMYMTGTDLSTFFLNNISAASKAIANGALGDNRFLIFKHSTPTTASLVEYKYKRGKCVSETLLIYNDITSLTEDAMVKVIAQAKGLAPAESYNLIISGHATAWVPKDQSSSWTKVAPAEPSINWEMMSTSPIPTRYLGSKRDGYFDVNELKNALEETQTHFNCIIFDECFMSSVEALYPLRNLCNYIIASPCEILGDGFPYETVLPKINAENGTNVDLQGICQEYYNFYSSYSSPSGCIALTVTSEIDALAEITRRINSAYSDDNVDIDALQAYERLNGNLFFDFEEYMLAKCQDPALSEEFTAQMAKTFPPECRLHTERFFANIGPAASSANNYEAYYTTINYYSGVTTSAPSSRLKFHWAETDWAVATDEQ